MSSNQDDHDTAPPVSVADSGDHGEGGKVKMIVSLVKKCLGVKDIASMRLSLPASLLEPVPNLEYSQPLDRPDLFAAINESEDPFERMLAVLRFAFTKDLKHVHGKVCKPYNSVLGEHFRAHWDVVPLEDPEDLIDSPSRDPRKSGESGSVRSGSFKSSFSTDDFESVKQASTAPTSPEPSQRPPRVRVIYLTEQVSHHPPVSAYYAVCPARHIELRGIDQISAKVSGTTLRIAAGQYNQGFFIHLTGGPGNGEEYHLTNQTGNVNGILRGNFYLTMSDSVVISCTNAHPSSKQGGIPRFRTIIEYKEESWLGRAHFLIEGVIFVVHDGETEHESWTKVKQVPHNRVAAIIDGTWKGHIRWKRVGVLSYPNTTSSVASSPSPSHAQLPRPSIPSASASRAEILSTGTDEWQTLIDVSQLRAILKEVRPLEKQGPFESRNLWRKVTEKLLSKEYSDATKEKVAIEQKQRDDSAERKRTGVEFVPSYFDKSLDKGWSDLTEEGRKAIEAELSEPSSYVLESTKTAVDE